MKTRVANRSTKVAPLQRPRERVMNYLDAEYNHAGVPGGTRLPTIRQLAHQLKVSERTVHSVFRTLNQERRIRSRVGQGTFLVSKPASGKREFRIALGIPELAAPPYNEYANRIYNGVLRATAASFPSLSLLARTLDTADSGASDASVDGLILVPVKLRDRIRTLYEQNGKPVVDINPSSEFSTTNFVSPDFFGSSRQLAQVWRETGRKNIMLLLGFKLEESVSSRLRRYGIEAGLGYDLLNGKVRFQVIEAGAPSYSEEAGYNAMQPILADKQNRPDAVLCMGDFLALGVVRAATAAGLKIPEDISIVGGTGNDLSHSLCPSLTQTVQPMEKLGEEAVAMISKRLASNERPPASLPGKIVPMPFAGGATTRPEENSLLKLGPHSRSSQEATNTT